MSVKLAKLKRKECHTLITCEYKTKKSRQVKFRGKIIHYSESIKWSSPFSYMKISFIINLLSESHYYIYKRDGISIFYSQNIEYLIRFGLYKSLFKARPCYCTKNLGLNPV